MKKGPPTHVHLGTEGKGCWHTCWRSLCGPIHWELPGRKGEWV